MAIITVDKASLAFGVAPLLNNVTFALEIGEKIGLIGRNGSGKSSFLKALASEIELDDGNIFITSGTKIVYIPQEPVLDPNHTISEEIFATIGSVKEDFSRYDAILDELNTNIEDTDKLLEELNHIQEKLEQNNSWQIKNSIDKVLSELNLNGNTKISNLSGGTKKRVAIAKTLIIEPDVILLDEPTNHLDIAGTLWLEETIRTFRGSVILITHDRAFLDHTVDKIIELDRGHLNVFPGSYARYKEWKEIQLQQEAKINHEFDKFLAGEEVWIRKGIEARRTRNEGRVRRLTQLRLERSQRREKVGQVNFEVDSGQKSGKIVADLHNVRIKFDDKIIIDNLSTTILRGDKIGLIGPNGVGKSTLLKIILDKLTPDSGRVDLGTKLQIAYFDQFREQLDENVTVQDVVSQGQDYVEINNRRVHIATYLEDFLFAPSRFRSPIKALSGGERNRLLLARLFSRPANVLVLDEPTNDLDIETLELLEELLNNYTGTVFLVSHDREFLDNVVTESLVFLGDGKILEIPGGYSDWIYYKTNYLDRNTDKVADSSKSKIGDNSATTAQNSLNSSTASSVSPISSASQISNQKTKLSYKEKHELATIPDSITALEHEQKELSTILSAGEIYKTNSKLAQEYQMRLSNIDQEILEKMERWEYLENKS